MYKVMLIVDNTLIGLNIKSCLEERNYVVYLQKSIENLKHNLWQLNDMDLVILDNQLPGVETEQVIVELKQKFPFLPIILLTNKISLAEAKQALKQGVTDFIIKPFSTDTVYTKVQKILPPKVALTGYGDDVLAKELEYEISRARRAKQPFSLVLIRGNDFVVGKDLVEEIENSLRLIDKVMEVNRGIILILPLTGAEGAKVVIDRVSNLLKKYLAVGMESLWLSMAVYPHDGENRNSLMKKLSEKLSLTTFLSQTL